MERMTYLDLLNNFTTWLEGNYLSPSAQLLFFRLAALWNQCGRPDRVQIDNRRLMLMIEVVTERPVIKARQALIDAGFLCYKKGKKGVPGSYWFLGSKPDSEPDSKTGSEPDTVSGGVEDRHNKRQSRDKDRDIYPPVSPDGETSPRGERDAAFAAFWAAYPRKVGKQAALKAFGKIKGVPVETILHAIEAQKKTDSWQKDGGQYIPHPATWLNQGRWEDEPYSPATQEYEDWKKRFCGGSEEP